MKVIIPLNDFSLIKTKKNVLIDPIFLENIEILINVGFESNLNIINDFLKHSYSLLCVSNNNNNFKLTLIKQIYVKTGICFYVKKKHIDVYFNKRTLDNVKVCLSNQ